MKIVDPRTFDDGGTFSFENQQYLTELFETVRQLAPHPANSCVRRRYRRRHCLWRQRCLRRTAYTRFDVDSRRAEEFTDKLAGAAEAMTVGNGFDERTQLGPLVTAEQVDRVDACVRIGQDEGAHLRTGGSRGEGELAAGNFYRPTVFGGVTQDMRIAREEIFGPVLSVLSYDDPDELADFANDTDYGLAAVIWSRDVRTANRLAQRIKTGTVYINMPPFLDAAAAWGGVQSGRKDARRRQFIPSFASESPPKPRVRQRRSSSRNGRILRTAPISGDS
ncbi:MULTISPECIES: aldehyde dehydrogenase family protein [unclassified Amycolatopsis]|uniref:aldehyde dehydrogenase family protein n=1 Tax=unclassified Amycolatopsis TaxID=2618356 RepID=UPI00287BB570|nr:MULTISPECIES: aldehyde dehydrogenase family protein [unclassified Amycolatopsis]